MSNKNDKDTNLRPGRLTISYRQLGTMNIRELRDAVIEDVAALQAIYNIRYVKNAFIKLCVTNEYGEEIKVYRPGGGTIEFMDTHHYRPACKDYDL